MEYEYFGIACLIIAALFLIKFVKMPAGNSPEDYSAELSKIYNPSKGVLGSEYQAKKSEERTKLLTTIAAEKQALVSHINVDTEFKVARFNQEAMPFRLREEEELRYATYENEKERLQRATVEGVPPTIRENVYVKQHEANIQIMLTVGQQKLLKQIEVDFERTMAELDLRMADVKLLMGYHQYDVLNDHLSRLLERFHILLAEPETPLKLEEMKRLKRQINTYRDDLNVRETELLQRANGNDL